MANIKLKDVTYTDVDSVDVLSAESDDYVRFVEYEGLIDGTIKNLIIPEGVTTIVNYLCNRYEDLESIEIPSGLTSIGNSSFSRCTSLSSIEIPSSVTTVNASAFDNCSGLTSVIFASNSQLTSIGNWAFRSTGLTSITIPSSVTSIGLNAFYNCTSLKEVVFKGEPLFDTTSFSGSVNIEQYDFSNATTIPTLPASGNMPHKNGCIVIIPDALYNDWIAAPVWSTITDVVYTKASEV